MRNQYTNRRLQKKLFQHDQNITRAIHKQIAAQTMQYLNNFSNRI